MEKSIDGYRDHESNSWVTLASDNNIFTLRAIRPWVYKVIILGVVSSRQPYGFVNTGTLSETPETPIEMIKYDTRMGGDSDHN